MRRGRRPPRSASPSPAWTDLPPPSRGDWIGLGACTLPYLTFPSLPFPSLGWGLEVEGDDDHRGGGCALLRSTGQACPRDAGRAFVHLVFCSGYSCPFGSSGPARTQAGPGTAWSCLAGHEEAIGTCCAARCAGVPRHKPTGRFRVGAGPWSTAARTCPGWPMACCFIQYFTNFTCHFTFKKWT